MSPQLSARIASTPRFRDSNAKRNERERVVAGDTLLRPLKDASKDQPLGKQGSTESPPDFLSAVFPVAAEV
jgi:hypothetical protein